MSQNETIAIGEATAADLRAYAVALGLEVKHGAKAADLRALIDAASPGITHVPLLVAKQPSAPVTLSADPAAVAQSSAPPPAANGRPVVPMCNLTVHAQKGEQPVVQVAVNGRNYNIERGKEVEVPYWVLNALEQAVEVKYEQKQENSRDRPEMVPTETPLYPFSVKIPPDPDQIRAYEAATADKFAPNA